MKKLYVSRNYIIADDNGSIKKVGTAKSSYSEAGGNFVAQDEVQRTKIIIPIADAATWLDAESGGSAYDETGMRTFFEDNTAVFNPGGATTFEELSDVPPYAGNGGKPIIVNLAETALEVGVEPVKRYLFTIDQAGIIAPTVNRTVVNETGVTWTWQYNSLGEYQISGFTPIAKVFVICGNNSDALFEPVSYVDGFGTATITFRKTMLNGAATADGLSNVSIEISLAP